MFARNKNIIILAVVSLLAFGWGAVSARRDLFPYSVIVNVFRPHPPDLYARYREQRARFFEAFSTPADIVVVGDSIMSDVTWHEAFPGRSIVNRSIRGDTTAGVLSRIPGILKPKPKTVLLLVGVNDLDNGDTPEATASRYRQIVEALTPHARVVTVSVLPCHDGKVRCDSLLPKIYALNDLIASIKGAEFIDMTPHMTSVGKLKAAYSYDGIHLTVEGFRAWRHVVEPRL